MSKNVRFRPTVIRTDRGLSIAGTRITLYQIKAGLCSLCWLINIEGHAIRLWELQNI
jgi:hypothetical protein